MLRFSEKIYGREKFVAWFVLNWHVVGWRVSTSHMACAFPLSLTFGRLAGFFGSIDLSLLSVV